jgi:selenide,water dikinase
VDQDVLSDPQTSGGLLVACAPDSVYAVLEIFRQQGFAHASEIGALVLAHHEGLRLQVS